MKTGVAISGGAAKSIASLGVLEALFEIGIKPDRYAGVSGGAIASVFTAAGFSPKEQLRLIMESGKSIYFKPTLSKGGLFKTDRAAARYLELLGDVQFKDLSVPVTINATDYSTGNIVYFSEGAVIPALCATASVPGFFVPYEYQNMLLLDGAVSNNLPVEPLLDHCDRTLGILTAGTKFNAKKFSTRSIVWRTSQLMQYHNSILRGEKCSLFLDVQGIDGFGMWDLKKGQQIFDAGYAYTMSRSSEIEATFFT